MLYDKRDIVNLIYECLTDDTFNVVDTSGNDVVNLDTSTDLSVLNLHRIQIRLNKEKFNWDKGISKLTFDMPNYYRGKRNEFSKWNIEIRNNYNYGTIIPIETCLVTLIHNSYQVNNDIQSQIINQNFKDSYEIKVINSLDPTKYVIDKEYRDWNRRISYGTYDLPKVFSIDLEKILIMPDYTIKSIINTDFVAILCSQYVENEKTKEQKYIYLLYDINYNTHKKLLNIDLDNINNILDKMQEISKLYDDLSIKN